MTTTKRFISFFMAVLMTFSLLAVSASAATTMGGLNVSYRMDGENVVETIVFSGATMIRTVTPTGTMTIKTIENGSTSTAKVNADYSVYKKFMRPNMVLQQLDLKLPGLSINIVM